jgi:hypothetical protein
MIGHFSKSQVINRVIVPFILLAATVDKAIGTSNSPTVGNIVMTAIYGVTFVVTFSSMMREVPR